MLELAKFASVKKSPPHERGGLIFAFLIITSIGSAGLNWARIYSMKSELNKCLYQRVKNPALQQSICLEVPKKDLKKEVRFKSI